MNITYPEQRTLKQEGSNPPWRFGITQTARE
jgi:hypothetical protein